MRVLHIIKSLGRGGAEMLLPETLNIHDKTQFEFYYIYFLPWKDQMVQSIREGGGEITCFLASNNIILMMQIGAVARYVRAKKIQLIHAHLPWAGVLARQVGKICNIPVVYTEHNKQERYHLLTRFMNLATLNKCTVIVPVSEDVAESIQKHKPSVNARIRLIHNGVNTDTFQRQHFDKKVVRKKLGIANDTPIIGTIAVFRFQKRLDLWMELAKKILTSAPDVHFVIVGDGPLKKDLLAKRDELGLTDRIHMPGLETEVRPYLAAFDIFMMCSIFEGLPVALLEAMAMELPVISTDAGGIKEVIKSGENGFLCSVNEPDELIKHALTLLRDESLRLNFGLRARKLVSEEFSMRKMVANLEGLYRDLIT